MTTTFPVALNGNFFSHGDAVALNSPSIVSAISPAAASSPASEVSTPSSTASTTVPRIAIRPNTTARPASINTFGIANSAAMSSALSPSSISAGTPLSMTSKEWVIPPRPKPGRKPATDTPPTKRKAQNRAAQRAFRERRAARVGELEEQLDDQKEDHDRTVRELNDRINQLEHETQSLQSRCQWLEKSLEEERQRGNAMARNRDNAQQPAIVPRTDSMVTMDTSAQPNPSRASRPEQNLQPAPRRATVDSRMFVESRPSNQSLSISQIISPPEEASEVMDLSCGGCQSDGPCSCAEEVLQDTGFGCGRCSIDTRCACIEESLREAIAIDHKRPFQPSSPSSKGPDEKRQRSDTEVGNMETDFTALFASTRNQGVTNSNGMLAQSQPQPLPSVEPRDSCGFCKDGTYCFCADSSSALPSIPQAIAQQTHTPPPSDDDVVPAPMEVTATGAIKLPGFQAMRQGRAAAAAAQPVSQPVKTSRCGPNGPGTCAQCLSDPKSGLFCRSLAANINRQQPADGGGNSSSGSGGCCGSAGPGGCCKTANSSDARGSNNTTTTATIPAASRPGAGFGVSIPCAEAYQTLASHRNFNEAADDIGSWLPKLRAAPMPENMRMGRAGQDHYSGRWAPIEVEAASIMTVLKDFDVRFGRGE